MLTLSIFLLDGCWGSQLMAILDFVAIYRLVAAEYPDATEIDVRLCGRAGGQVVLGNGLPMPVEAWPAAAGSNQLVVVPGIEYGQLRRVLNDTSIDRATLRAVVAAGSSMLSVSTGAFVLAESGLLDGREAVTHRRFEAPFRKRYPAVRLKSGIEFVDHGAVCTAASLTGAIYWLARQLQARGNHEAVSRCLVLTQQDSSLAAELWLADTFEHKRHGDDAIAAVQHFIDMHYADRFSVAGLAAMIGGSESSLKRRFKAAAGIPVTRYQQLVRVARMKYLLLNSDAPVDNICFDIGYADPRFARRLFVEMTGLSPRAYRQRCGPG